MTDKAIEAATQALKLYWSKGLVNFEDAAKAAIEAYEAVMWRPIEEAPKDGSSVLLVINNKEVVDVVQGIGHWTTHNGGGWTWYGIAGTPTHFRPLPTPPKE